MGTHSIYACAQCGVLVEEAPADRHCVLCDDGLLTAAGGFGSHSSEALFAWVRRDDTKRVEAWGMALGLLVGGLLVVPVVLLWESLGAAAILLPAYGGLLGGLVGRLSAIRIHAFFAPGRLAPLVNARERSRLAMAAAVLASCPILIATGVAIFGTTHMTHAIKHGVGAVWLAFAG
jgi:hypothetical protein